MYSYIHIPFCESKCDYCRFASYAGIDQLKVNFYVDFLCREIEISEIQKKALKSVYFGGGTPTTLSSKQLGRILQTLEKKFGFSKHIEINLETTPENVTHGNLLAWRKIGINRVSMGVQSLNEDTLKEIHRKPSSEIYRALRILEEGIIPNVSVDFIIGLPFVKRGELQTYIVHLLEKYDVIKHMSVYMLEDYYETPDEIDSKFQNVTYPVNWSKDGIAEEDFLDEYVSIKEYLNSQKIKSYEISNFSKKGYECKHNRAYWNHKEIAAFGLGASGFITSPPAPLLRGEGRAERIRYKNSDDFGEYYKGEKIEYDELSEKDILLEKIMFGLRTGGVEKQYIGANQDKVKTLEKEKLIRISKNKIHLGEKGYTLLDTISLELLEE